MLKLNRPLSYWVTLFAIFLILSERPAFALYVDPGSGLLVWQIITAAFVGGIYHLRRSIFGSLKSLSKFWRKPEAGEADRELAQKKNSKLESQH